MIQCNVVYEENGMSVFVTTQHGRLPTSPAEWMKLCCFAPHWVKDDILLEWFLSVISDHERLRATLVNSGPIPLPDEDDARYTMVMRNCRETT